MKNFYLSIITIFIFYTLNVCFANNTYPYSYRQLEFHEGGKLLISTNDGNEPKSFLIKPNWAESESIFTWKGILRNKAKGFTVGSANIIDAYPLEASLLVAWSENEHIFIVHLDSLVQKISILELTGIINNNYGIDGKWLGKTGENEFLLQIRQNLYLVKIDKNGNLSSSMLANEVISAISLYNMEKELNYKVAYLVSREAKNILYFIDNKGIEHLVARLSLSDISSLQAIDDKVAVINSSESQSQIFIQIPELNGRILNFWLETKQNLLCFKKFENENRIYSIINQDNNYFILISKLRNFQELDKIKKIQLPEDFTEPIKLISINEIFICLFRNGIVTFDVDGKILSADFYPIGEQFSDIPSLSLVESKLVISCKTASLILEPESNKFWFFNRFISTTGRYIIPLCLVLLLIIFIQLFRHKKRLLKEVLELPSIGVIMVFDKTGRLNTANDIAKKFLGVTGKIAMKKPFNYYLSEDYFKPVGNIIENSLINKDTYKGKISLIKDNDYNEWYCTIVPFKNIAGNFRGLIFTGIDITEQFERKRLSNWAQLAHDMQTNLSTIRLNAEQIDFSEDISNIERRKKILHQVNILIQRVRDIVTVGRSDVLDKTFVNSSEICMEIKQEFDETVFKYVEFEFDIQPFNILCDKPKIIRALRNAVENGIKSLQGNNGTITVKCWNDVRFAYFSIKDSGIGMEKSIKDNMLRPYFTTSRKQGGTGIGTMIMQQVMEMHGGQIEIISEKGTGTEITFIFPINSSDKKKKR